MQKPIHLIAFIFVAMFFAPISLANEAASDLVSKIEAKYKGVNSMHAKFVQVTKSTLGESKEEGEMFLKRPAKMHWAFEDKNSVVTKVFITDGKTMWVYTKADNQVIVFRDIQKSGGTADAVLQSLSTLRSSYDVKERSVSDSDNSITLEPKEQGAFKSLELTVDAELIIKKMVLVDSFDNTTTLSFTNVKLNPALDEAKFDFKIPDGVQVVEGG